MFLNRHALKDFRKAKGLTVTELAARVDITQSHLSNIEAGRRVPSPTLLAALGETLGLHRLSLISSTKVETDAEVAA